jgi:tight adherence protein B
MIVVLIAFTAAYGMHLTYTALAMRWTGTRPGPRSAPTVPDNHHRLRDLLAQSGLGAIRPFEVLTALTCAWALGAIVCFALFGTIIASCVGGTMAATAPIAAIRQRRQKRLTVARQSWPRMIEELRLLTASAGRSLPQALLEVGLGGPREFREAFASAQREWTLTTDFPRTLLVLRNALADPTCDAICETLLIAHEAGGSGVEQRLAELALDRREDAKYRNDVEARQSGVRFARRFVLLVPLGMAAAGLSVGTGKDAYQSPLGQIAVLGALSMIAVCWVWAGRMLQLPGEERVFVR